ncbi:RagB/SusD family nutrient uptake outer membrane protein [Mucilaginibacter sp. OK098]|uniref:RagB/SusD family nutrient uptake outer membrane protein n=1 Tax=Mucilaginibacter sp. OK098 TaxID=1855297 RepID=UPI000913F5CB|nr:RagB/SusD family nutrient uptake outer membrane protein [Mucilaginibacter sp. OK098]SHM76519.1 Starch-binding associating with outer membrane [Mucilaginibacter sp. OK098]
MKIKFNKSLVLLGLIVLSMSCKKVFDVNHPGGPITPEQEWGNPDFIKGYVTNFYNILPSWNRNEEISAEAFSGGSGGNALNFFLTGKYTTQSGYPDRVWDWASLRGINNFFANIDKSKSVLSDADYKSLKGQAYFFRAYLYYRMVKVLGGVPIITVVQDPTADINTLLVKRNTSLECFDFINKQLDSAINLLPVSYDADNTGRVTKGAAMAVKGEALLLKASPLFCKSPNTGYWNDAYTALASAKTELDADGYGLYTDNTAKTNENMWYDKAGAAKEMILSVRFHYPEKTNGFQQGQRPLTETSGAAGSCDPTWEMVKEYPMKNGLDISDPNSGYDPTEFWKNRDPRFYTAIVYNGARYDFADITPRVQWIFNGIAGDDAYKATANYNITGFYCRKGIDTTLGAVGWSHQAFDWPIIRYAEVLLNLAEAANETGHSGDAKNYIVQIRKRAHIDLGSGNYGLATSVGADYQSTLNAVMKEREIEFAFEGKRFWDLRRRRMFSVLNSFGTLHAYGPYLNRTAASTQYGVDITQSNSGIAFQLSNIIVNSPASFDRNSFLKAITNFVYEPIDLSATNQIQIPDSYYFGPIDPQYILQNKNLQQNVGWDNGSFNPVIQ